MTAQWARAAWVLVMSAPVMAFAAGANPTLPKEPAGFVLAAKESDSPLSRDELFGVAPEVEKNTKPVPKAETAPASKDDLFGIEPAMKGGQRTPAAKEALPSSKDELFGEAPAIQKTPRAEVSPWQGFFQTELGYAYADPEHWTKTMARLELGTHGQFGNGVRWKVSGRLDYNPVYDLTDYYSASVRRDQLVELQLRETYLDFSAGGLDWRVGRQHIVWGEMVGLFFADVVSAKDMREFVLPDFQTLRIPQWAARAEYFKDDFHAEMVWIPFPSYDRMGKPFDPAKSGAGADFFPYPVSPAGIPLVAGEQKPDYGLNHTNVGLRLSQLTHGWDVSGFVYSSMDSQATFYRDPVNKQVFYPRHDRIWQAGGTLAKDLGPAVLKAEAVYTDGRRYNTLNLVDEDGLVKQNTLDWAVGLDFNPTAETRLNAQLFQRVYFDHDPYSVFDRLESGASFLVNHQFSSSWEAEALLVHSLNRSEWMLRPKVSWKFQPNWRLTGGVDVFHGPPTGIFGRFDQQDRVYTELRRDF